MGGHIRSYFIFVAFLLLVITGRSAAFRLPDTGQSICYSGTSPVSCAGTGQDGAYSMNPLSYADNGNNTITDNITGLMWQKTENPSTYTWYQASGIYDFFYNPTSEDVCGSLVLGGHTDWRLPAERELSSLVDYSRANPGPMINSTYFPGAQQSNYWSATTYAANTSNAWHVLFSDGPDRYSEKGSYYYVRCVRGSTADFGNFADNGNNTVTDNSTGLVWQKSEAGTGTWSSALSYCESLSLAGMTDWRLPNIKELESLADQTRFNRAINTSFFPNAYSNYYWSSTSYTSFPDQAWTIYFHDGRVEYYNKANLGFNIRCVRGQSVSSDISVSKVDSPDPVQTGQQVTYTIIVTNNGPDTASGVRLTDALPGNAVFVSANSTQGTCSQAAGTVTCTIGSMLNAAAVTVTIVATAPSAPGTLSNAAIATSTSPDPDSSNNTATANTNVTAVRIQLNASAYSTTENSGSVTVTARRTGGSSGAAGISYATGNGTAVAGADYTAASGILSWPDGDTSDKSFDVMILDNAVAEAAETFTVTLSSPTGGAVLGSPSSATVTIADDEPVVSITTPDPSATEAGPATGRFSITRTGPVASPLTVYFTVSGTATPGGDYLDLGTSVIIPAGFSNADIIVTPVDDPDFEVNETAVVTLSSDPSYSRGSPVSGIVTIQSDDPEPAGTFYLDHFDDMVYTDRWTEDRSGVISIAETGTMLVLQIAKPSAGCSYDNLSSIPAFSAENLVVETGAALKGGGEMFLRLSRDTDNFIQFGLNIGELPNLTIGSSDAGIYSESAFDGGIAYNLKRKSYKNRTFTVVKTGDDFRAFVNGIAIGSPVTNTGIGNSGLKVGLFNSCCSTDAKGPKTSFDYMFVKEPISDGSPTSSVTLFSPNGNQTLTMGSVHLIQWSAPASAVNFTLEYSTDNGGKWKLLDSGLQGSSYAWKLSKVKPLATYRLRVTGFDAGGASLGSDTSDSSLTIAP